MKAMTASYLQTFRCSTDRVLAWNQTPETGARWPSAMTGAPEERWSCEWSCPCLKIPKNINFPYFERIVDSNPLLTSKKNPHAHADFPISLSSNKTCSVLPRSFLPALPSSSWNLSKLLLLPKVSHTDFPIFLFSSPTHKPSLGNFPVWACLVCSTQTTAIWNFPDSFALIILWSFNVLGR